MLGLLSMVQIRRHYRIHILAESDLIVGLRGAHCASDEDARRLAAEVIGGYPVVEIWCGRWIVGRYTADELAQGFCEDSSLGCRS